jgi:hypothetical protein
MGLSGWGLLGAIMAALMSFSAYAYWSIDANSANRASVGTYVIPELEAAQPNQAGSAPTHTENSPSAAQEPERPPSLEETPTISSDPEAGLSLRPTGTLPSKNEVASAGTSVPPPPGQSVTVSTPIDGCTSQIRCTEPLLPEAPNQSNTTDHDGPSCTNSNWRDSCVKEEIRENIKDIPVKRLRLLEGRYR